MAAVNLDVSRTIKSLTFDSNLSLSLIIDSVVVIESFLGPTSRFLFPNFSSYIRHRLAFAIQLNNPFESNPLFYIHVSSNLPTSLKMPLPPYNAAVCEALSEAQKNRLICALLNTGDPKVNSTPCSPTYTT